MGKGCRPSGGEGARDTVMDTNQEDGKRKDKRHPVITKELLKVVSEDPLGELFNHE